MIKKIEDNNVLYAKIIKASYKACDNEFYTQENDEIQYGFLSYKKDLKTGAHYHNYSEETTDKVDEILVIQTGSARIDFYNNKGTYIKSCKVYTGDTIIMYDGGHNILFYEDTKILAIKKGTQNNSENVRIVGVSDSELIIEND